MDSLFRLRRLLWALAGAFFLLLPGVPDAFARDYVYGTPTGYFPESFCAPTPLNSGNYIALSWLIFCELGGNSYYANSSTVVRLGDRVPVSGNGAMSPPAADAYTACSPSVITSGGTVEYDCSSGAVVHYTGRTWAVCPSAQVEPTWVGLTITGGNLTSGLTTGDYPPITCSSGCYGTFEDSGTGAARIRPGESAVGDDIWVELNYSLNGIPCEVGAAPEGLSAASLPATACDPLSGTCGSGGSTGGTEGATGTFDSAISGNTAAILAALNQLRTSSDLTLSGSYSDCSTSVTCSGDPLRCAQYVSLRDSYCDAKPTDPALQADAEALGLQLLGETPEAIRESLKASATPFDVSAGLARPRFLSGVGCPAPQTFTVLGASHSVGFDAFCDLAPLLSMFLLVTSGVVSIRIFAGGFS